MAPDSRIDIFQSLKLPNQEHSSPFPLYRAFKADKAEPITSKCPEKSSLTQWRGCKAEPGGGLSSYGGKLGDDVLLSSRTIQGPGDEPQWTLFASSSAQRSGWDWHNLHLFFWPLPNAANSTSSSSGVLQRHDVSSGTMHSFKRAKEDGARAVVCFVLRVSGSTVHALGGTAELGPGGFERQRPLQRKGTSEHAMASRGSSSA